MSCVIRPKNFDFHSSIFTFFLHARQLKECYQDFYDSVTISALSHDPIRLNQLDWVALTLSMNEQEQNNAIYILIRFKDFAILEICICVRIMLLRAHCGWMEKLNLSHRLVFFANFAKRLDFTLYNDVPFRLRHHQKTIVRHFSADSNAVFRCYDGAIKTHKTRTAACNPQSIHRDVDWRKEDKFHVFARDTDRKKVDSDAIKYSRWFTLYSQLGAHVVECLWMFWQNLSRSSSKCGNFSLSLARCDWIKRRAFNIDKYRKCASERYSVK